MNITGVENVEIIVDGTVLMSPHYKDFVDTLDGWWVFYNGSNIKMHGTGIIDGQGYMWWIREWLQKNTNGRPNMINW